VTEASLAAGYRVPASSEVRLCKQLHLFFKKTKTKTKQSKTKQNKQTNKQKELIIYFSTADRGTATSKLTGLKISRLPIFLSPSFYH